MLYLEYLNCRASFAMLTLLDHNFDRKGVYYLVKITLLCLLFLRPINGAERILTEIRQANLAFVPDDVS